ncbi:MAG: hypothetical protein K1X88_20490 [Nannocystaceae bacterium]|nr:hypothetical protein [Nannocystaceae bacterium]
MRSRIPVALVLSACCIGACTHDADGLGGVSFGSGASGGPGGDSDAASSSAGDDDDDGGSTGVSASASAGDSAAEGAASEGSDGGPIDTSGGDGGPPDTGAETAADGIGECSNFTGVDQFHAWMNTERSSYAGGLGGGGHDRYKGLPWQGEYHQNFTFAVQFAWDDGLAAQAQAEAEAIAAGGSPTGTQSNGSNGLPFCPAKPLWIDGLNTASWKITLGERAEDWMPPPEHPDSCPPPFALSVDNQHARMGLHYHDFGGDGPAIGRVGIGAAADADCQVWWVLQFGP